MRKVELLHQLELLTPALVMTPILSLASLILFILVLAIAPNAYAVLTGLLYLLVATLSAYYWVGVKTLYGKYHPSSPVFSSSASPLYQSAPPNYNSLNNQ